VDGSPGVRPADLSVGVSTIEAGRDVIGAPTRRTMRVEPRIGAPGRSGLLAVGPTLRLGAVSGGAVGVSVGPAAGAVRVGPAVAAAVAVDVDSGAAMGSRWTADAGSGRGTGAARTGIRRGAGPGVATEGVGSGKTSDARTPGTGPGAEPGFEPGGALGGGSSDRAAAGVPDGPLGGLIAGAGPDNVVWPTGRGGTGVSSRCTAGASHRRSVAASTVGTGAGATANDISVSDEAVR